MVGWAPGVDPTGPSTGMYAFVAQLPEGSDREVEREIPEGLLSWKRLAWACDPANGAVVGNAPRSLPGLLDGGEPREYVGGELVGVSMGRL